jgi:hypothetical protein
MSKVFYIVFLSIGLVVGCTAGHYHGVAVTLEKQMELSRSDGAMQLTGMIELMDQMQVKSK